jgi:hypothetical protein
VRRKRRENKDEGTERTETESETGAV